MTLWAERKGADHVVIHHSPSDTHIEEHVVHLRSFHTELGKLLGHIESGSSEPASTTKPDPAVAKAEQEEAAKEPTNVEEQEEQEREEDKSPE
jgi:hypothetical protein